MQDEQILRDHLIKQLDWTSAHTDFRTATKGIPEDLRGARPSKVPYSPWELVEHMRIAQRDILDFCRDSDYQQPAWPEEYWPETSEPPASKAWRRSVNAVQSDLEEMKALVADESTDLFAPIPHGDGQTILREVLLVADHNAYHIGQLVVVRRLLGIWE